MALRGDKLLDRSPFPEFRGRIPGWIPRGNPYRDRAVGRGPLLDFESYVLKPASTFNLEGDCGSGLKRLRHRT
jgi:hypothetical protein